MIFTLPLHRSPASKINQTTFLLPRRSYIFLHTPPPCLLSSYQSSLFIFIRRNAKHSPADGVGRLLPPLFTSQKTTQQKCLPPTYYCCRFPFRRQCASPLPCPRSVVSLERSSPKLVLRELFKGSRVSPLSAACNSISPWS